MSDSPPPPATDAAPLVASVPANPDEDDILDLTPRVPDDYNPADYRWVPVRRRPRHDGWTEEKQRRLRQHRKATSGAIPVMPSP